MIWKSASVSCRWAAVSWSSISDARSFSGSLEYESRSIEGSVNPSRGVGALAGSFARFAFLGLGASSCGAAASDSAFLPSMRVSDEDVPSMGSIRRVGIEAGWFSSPSVASVSFSSRSARRAALRSARPSARVFAEEDAPCAMDSGVARGCAAMTRVSALPSTSEASSPDASRLFELRRILAKGIEDPAPSSARRSARLSLIFSMSLEMEKPMMHTPATATPMTMTIEMIWPNRVTPSQAMPAPI